MEEKKTITDALILRIGIKLLLLVIMSTSSLGLADTIFLSIRT